eukprot:363200-Chlamydomonas_euryale.AAC.13
MARRAVEAPCLLVCSHFIVACPAPRVPTLSHQRQAGRLVVRIKADGALVPGQRRHPARCTIT